MTNSLSACAVSAAGKFLIRPHKNSIAFHIRSDIVSPNSFQSIVFIAPLKNPASDAPIFSVLSVFINPFANLIPLLMIVPRLVPTVVNFLGSKSSFNFVASVAPAPAQSPFSIFDLISPTTSPILESIFISSKLIEALLLSPAVPVGLFLVLSVNTFNSSNPSMDFFSLSILFFVPSVASCHLVATFFATVVNSLPLSFATT